MLSGLNRFVADYDLATGPDPIPVHADSKPAIGLAGAMEIVDIGDGRKTRIVSHHGQMVCLNARAATALAMRNTNIATIRRRIGTGGRAISPHRNGAARAEMLFFGPLVYLRHRWTSLYGGYCWGRTNDIRLVKAALLPLS